MNCSEINFVTSQCVYGIMISHPNMSEDKQIEKAIRMARKIIDANRGSYKSDSQEREFQEQTVVVRAS